MSWTLKRTVDRNYPCMNCQKRTAECHATCEEYLQAVERRTKQLEERRKRNQADVILSQQARDRSIYWMKHRRK